MPRHWPPIVAFPPQGAFRTSDCGKPGRLSMEMYLVDLGRKISRSPASAPTKLKAHPHKPDSLYQQTIAASTAANLQEEKWTDLFEGLFTVRLGLGRSWPQPEKDTLFTSLSFRPRAGNVPKGSFVGAQPQRGTNLEVSHARTSSVRAYDLIPARTMWLRLSRPACRIFRYYGGTPFLLGMPVIPGTFLSAHLPPILCCNGRPPLI